MSERGLFGGRWFWIVGGFVAAVSLATLGYIWRSGGIALPGGPASPATVEECDARVTTGTAFFPDLAPALTQEFLRTNGYEVAAPIAPTADTVQIIGRRAGAQCTITLRAATSTAAFADLGSGAAQVALSMRPITDRDQAMLAGAGAGDFVRDLPLAEHLIAYDAVAFVAHEDNPVTELTLDHVREIGIGLITNWAPINGVEAPLTLYMSVDGTSPSDYPNDLAPVRHPILESMQQRGRPLPTEGAVLEALRADPGGFAGMSSAFVRDAPGLRVLALRNGPAAQGPSEQAVRSGAYPLIRRFFAYVRPSAMQENVFVQRYIAFLESDAARLTISEAGYFPPDIRGRAGERSQVAGDCIFGTLEAAAVAAATTGASRVGEPLRFIDGGLELDAASQGLVRDLAATLAAQLQQGAVAVLVGHADMSGSAPDNRALGLRRAIAVREAFEEAGVFGIVTESAGEMCFNRENATEDGRRANQRVELWIRPAA